MSKDAINQYSTIAANNTDIGGININTGWSPANVGPAVRELMAQLADVNNQISAWTGGQFGAINSTGSISATGTISGVAVSSTGTITGIALSAGTGPVTCGAITASGGISTATNQNIFSGGSLSGKNITGSAGIVATGTDGGGAHFRAQGANYGAFIKNDNTVTALYLTNSGSPSGSANSLRPLTVTNSNGAVAIDSTGAGVTMGGALAVTGAVTAANGTSGSQVVNIGQFSSSLNLTGYQVFPSGLIMQWGNTIVTLSTASGFPSVGSVSFPLSFPSAAYNCVIQNGDSNAQPWPCYMKSGYPIGTGFSFNVHNNSGGGPSGTYRVMWVAFGK